MTTNYGFNLPTIGEVGDPNWGSQLNTNFESIDTNIYNVGNFSSGITTDVETNTSSIETNASNIINAVNYSSGIASIAGQMPPMLDTDSYERAPFNAVRIEYGSGLNAEQYIAVTEGFDTDNVKTYVQAVSSGLAYQEHCDLVFSKRFTNDTSLNGITLDFATEVNDASDNKIVSTVYQNGVAQTSETHNTPAENQDFTTSLNTDLTAMWNFNESGNMADSEVGPTSADYDMNYSGASYTANGKYEGGCDFESGSSNYAYTIHPDCILSGSQTWAVLLKPESHSSTGYIFSKGVYDDYDYMNFSNFALYLTTGGTFTFWVIDSDQSEKSVSITPSGSSIDGNWWLVVARFDSSSGEIKLYVGDVTAGTIESNTTSTGTGDLFPSFSAMYDMANVGVGAQYDSDGDVYSNYYDGIMDELCFWDVVKSDDDITDLFNSGNLRYYGIPEGSGSDGTINNFGSNWTGGDEMILKLELWSKDNNYSRLYGVDFDLT